MSDVDHAVMLIKAYQDAINAGNFATAYALLAPTMQQAETLAAFTSERTAFHKSSGNAYTVTPKPPNTLPLDQWLPVSQEPNLDRAHAVLVEVDYPKLAGNNAGYDIYVVGPIGSTWYIWPVR